MKSCVSASTPGVTRRRTFCGHAALGSQRAETLHLLEAVDHDPAHSGVEALGQLGGRLVVAMHVDALHRKAGAQRESKLTAARHVEAAVLLGDEPEHRERHERLAGVDDVDVLPVVARPLHVLGELVADRSLVHHVDGGASLVRQLNGIDAADPQVAVFDLGGHRQDRHQVVPGLEVGVAGGRGVDGLPMVELPCSKRVLAW